MNVKGFLEQTVEGYLFADINEMTKIKVDGDGNCAYPIVMSVLAGIELLGTLTYPHCITPQQANLADKGGEKQESEIGNPQFGWYWKHFLAPTNPDCYKLKGSFSLLIRSLVRNGLAHTFIAKAVEIRKFQPNFHMKSSSTSRLIIDCTRFSEDFKRSYQHYIRPILDGEPTSIKKHKISLQTMQERLNEMAAVYAKDVDIRFREFKGEIPIVSDTENVIGSFNSPTGMIIHPL